MPHGHAHEEAPSTKGRRKVDSRVLALAELDGALILKNLDLECSREEMGYRLMRFALFIREMPEEQMSEVFARLIERFGLHRMIDKLNEYQ